MITIGRLADFAGVTIKAVRHYHQRGLPEEPPRDSYGYRRYSAEDAMDLVKIKTPAEAGLGASKRIAGRPKGDPAASAAARGSGPHPADPCGGHAALPRLGSAHPDRRRDAREPRTRRP